MASQYRKEFQSFLDRSNALVLAQDLDGYADTIELPLVFVSQGVTKVVTDRADLDAQIKSVGQCHRSQHVTDKIRRLLDYTLLGPDLAFLRFETTVLSGAQRVVDPYEMMMTLRRRDGAWRAICVYDALKTFEWPQIQILPGDREEPHDGTLLSNRASDIIDQEPQDQNRGLNRASA